MFIARHPTSPDDRLFAALEALADGALCLGQLLHDEAGRPSDLRLLRVGGRLATATGLVPAETGLLGDLLREAGAEGDWLTACGETARSGEAQRFTLCIGGRRLSGRVVPAGEAGCLALAFAEETEAEALRRRNGELSHRVMNSFAVLSAMMAMEARAADPAARAPLRRLQGRVEVMSLLYRQLEGAGDGGLDAAAYLRSLAQSLARMQGPAVTIEVETAVSPLRLPARRAASLGLLVNELMTGAADRAGGAALHLRLSLRPADGSGDGALRLTIEDPDDRGRCAGQGDPPALAGAFAAELDGAIETGPGQTALTFRP